MTRSSSLSLAVNTGRRVEARLGAELVIIRAEGKVVASHTRSLHKGSEDLTLDHYLEALTRKPGALAGATALAAARASGAFTPAHQRFWDTARRGLGDGPGTRALVGVLLLHRTLPAAAVAAGMAAAAKTGRCDPDLVAVEARRHLEGGRTPTARPPTQLRNAPQHHDHRPSPALAGYDDLLQGELPGGEVPA